jgi:hypothetical protein
MDLNKLPYYPNILLVTGNGRNVGKTTFSCAVIEHLKEEKIIGVKISPHFHEFDPEEEDVLYQMDDIIIIEEHRKNTGKDSAKLLAAGASRVFFIMANDHSLQNAFNKLIEFAGIDCPMIIESAALRNVIIPAQFLLLSKMESADPKMKIKHLIDYVDYTINLFHNHHDFTPKNIGYINSEWRLFL